MRYRLSDLVLLVAIVATAAGMFVAASRGERATAMVCLVLFLSLPVLLILRPRIGNRRCPYCERWMDPKGTAEDVVCGECGSHLARAGRGPLLVVSCPADERTWARKFLPKLRRLRTEMRPGP
jgi:hypothetical protein